MPRHRHRGRSARRLRGSSQTTNASPFARRYQSTTTLSGGRVGARDFNVATNNTASGNVTITDDSRKAATRANEFSLGVHGIAGSVDPQTGAFTLSGNIPGSGPFTMSGTLPTATNPGSYTLAAGGETYGRTIPANGTNPTPTPTPENPAPNVSRSTPFAMASIVRSTSTAPESSSPTTAPIRRRKS